MGYMGVYLGVGACPGHYGTYLCTTYSPHPPYITLWLNKPRGSPLLWIYSMNQSHARPLMLSPGLLVLMTPTNMSGVKTSSLLYTKTCHTSARCCWITLKTFRTSSPLAKRLIILILLENSAMMSPWRKALLLRMIMHLLPGRPDELMIDW